MNARSSRVLCIFLALLLTSAALAGCTSATATPTRAAGEATPTTAGNLSTPTPTAASADPTATPTEGPIPTEQVNGPQKTVTGMFYAAPRGDYLHLYMYGTDHIYYAFFVLQDVGLDVEKLTYGKTLRVTYVNVDMYMPELGEVVNLDKALVVKVS